MAIVCADTVAHARAAAEKVKVDYEELPAYMSAPAAMAEDAMEIHPGTPNIYYYQHIAKGEDTAPIFEKADVVVEDDFYVGRQPHMPMEPDCGLAYLNDDGNLCIHSKSIALGIHAAHDRRRPGRGPGKPGHGPEPGRRHLRVQVQPDHGSPGGRGLPGHPASRWLPGATTTTSR